MNATKHVIRPLSNRCRDCAQFWFYTSAHRDCIARVQKSTQSKRNEQRPLFDVYDLTQAPDLEYSAALEEYPILARPAPDSNALKVQLLDNFH